MKNKILILLMSFVLIGFGTNLKAQSDKKEKSKNKETIVYDVSMHCENCKKKIERSIAYEKGVSNMKVDLDSKTVKIEYQPNKTDTIKLKKALQDLGYDVNVHKSDSKTL